MREIPAGYWLQYVVNECDDDNEHSLDIYGLDANQVKFFVNVLKLFSLGGDLGNSKVSNSIPDNLPFDFLLDEENINYSVELEEYLDEPIDILQGVKIKMLIDTLPEESVPDGWKPTEEENTIRKLWKFYNYNLQGLINTWCDGEYWCYYERHKVFEIKQPIFEVTSKFK